MRWFKKIWKEITISEKLVDVTECIVQRPKDSELQTYYYSGKKKKHTIKIQLIVDEKTRKIVSIAFDAGSIHDFLLFKNTTKNLNKSINFLADSGYQGITNIFKNSMIQKKNQNINHSPTKIRI